MLAGVPLCERTTVYFSLLQLMDVWVASNAGLLQRASCVAFHTGGSVLASARSPSSSESFVKPFGMALAPGPPEGIVRRWQMQILEDKARSTPPVKIASCFHEKKFLKKNKRPATENRSQHCSNYPRVSSSWPWGIWMGDNKVTYLIETGYSLTVLEQGPGFTQGSGGSYKLEEEMLPRKPN